MNHQLIFPIEILDIVFSYLDIKSIFTSRLVAKRFNILSKKYISEYKKNLTKNNDSKFNDRLTLIMNDLSLSAMADISDCLVKIQKLPYYSPIKLDTNKFYVMPCLDDYISYKYYDIMYDKSNVGQIEIFSNSKIYIKSDIYKILYHCLESMKYLIKKIEKKKKMNVTTINHWLIETFDKKTD